LSVNAGDALEFELDNMGVSGPDPNTSPGGTILTSIPSDNPDGANHAYATPWPGGYLPGTLNVDLPASYNGFPVMFVGMEDLEVSPFGNSGLVYNQDEFLVDNVQFTPEPGSFLLLGSGLFGLAGLLRRKLRA
jgi:hypothetical protein